MRCSVIVLPLLLLLALGVVVCVRASFTFDFAGESIAFDSLLHPAALASRRAEALAGEEDVDAEVRDHFLVACRRGQALALDDGGGGSGNSKNVHLIPRPPHEPAHDRRTRSAYVVFDSPSRLARTLDHSLCRVRLLDHRRHKISSEFGRAADNSSADAPSLMIGMYVSLSLAPGDDAARIADGICAMAPDVFLRCVREHDDSPDLVRVVFNRTHRALRAGGGAERDALLRRVAALRHVRRISPAHEMVFLNNIATLTVQSRDGTSRRMWNHGVTGAGQLVAIADTGVDYDMCFFFDPQHPTPAFWPAANPAHRKIYSYRPCVGYDYVVEHLDHSHAHGTHVAGSLVGERYDVATAGDALDAAHDSGMAKGAKLFFSDVSCGSTSGIMVPHDTYDLFAPGRKAGARVHSNSWGFDFTPQVTSSYEAIDRQTDRFAFEHRAAMLLVFAAGNDPARGVLKPGSSKNVLTVGAHHNNLAAAAREQMAGFSAHGPTYDGRLKPEVCGPGQPVTSADSDGSLLTHNCGTASKSGTSMATPHIAGAGVLVRHYFADGFFPHGWRGSGPARDDLSSAALKALLVTAARPLAGVGAAAPNVNEGFGGVNLEELLRFDDTPAGAERDAKKTTHLAVADNETVGAALPLQQAEFCVSLDAVGAASTAALGLSARLRATLSWMDPPLAAEGSHHSLVNDLDLMLIHDDGTVVYSNGNKDGPVSNSNTEQIVLPSGGDARTAFLLVVRAAHLETAVQDFALVALGAGIRMVRRGSSGSGADACAHFQCPAGCSSRGSCAGGVCKCTEPTKFTGVDCALCDSASVCHGNGVCKVESGGKLSCACGEHVDAKADPMCGTCASGYFGPACVSTCNCNGHGTCDHASGRCTCAADAQQGYWSVEGDCAYCAFDHTRVTSQFPAAFKNLPPTAVAAPCVAPSYWCSNRGERRIVLDAASNSAFLQINDRGSYDNSMTCVWRIEAAGSSTGGGSHRSVVHLTFLALNVEYPYDSVKIYTAAEMEGIAAGDKPAEAVRPDFRLSGDSSKLASVKQPIASRGSVMFVVFESDYVGPDKGFVAHVTSLRTCAADTCSGHGVCNSATGECGCESHFDPDVDCAACVRGFAGDDCATPVAVAPTAGNGSSGPRHHGGVGVSQCYSADGLECSGHGVCSPSLGRCVCDAFHGGFLCELSCPSFDGVLCGGGTCVAADAACDCSDAAVSSMSTLPPKLSRSALGGATCQLLLDNVRHLSADSPHFGPAVVPILRNQQGGIVVAPLSTATTASPAGDGAPTAPPAAAADKMDKRVEGTLGTPIFTAPWPAGDLHSVAHITVVARRAYPAAAAAAASPPGTKTAAAGAAPTAQEASAASPATAVHADPLSVPFRVEAFVDWQRVGLDEPDATWMNYGSGPLCAQLHRRPRSGRTRAQPGAASSSESDALLAIAIFAQTEVLEVFVLVSFDPTFRCDPSRRADLLSSADASSSSQQQQQQQQLARVMSSSSGNSFALSFDGTATADQLATKPPSNLAVILGVAIATTLVGAVLAAGRGALLAQARRKHRAVRRRIRQFVGNGQLGDQDGDGQRLRPEEPDEEEEEDDEEALGDIRGPTAAIADDDDDEFVNDPIATAQEMEDK